nr:hypothetical protein [Thioalkalivibrio thiocyanodenitrificans]
MKPFNLPATVKPLGLGVLLTLTLLAGCSESGPAEEAGERIDDAVEEAGERIEDATREAEDAIDPPGPAERAGRQFDDAMERATGD